jgi:hypothetical protein
MLTNYALDVQISMLICFQVDHTLFTRFEVAPRSACCMLHVLLIIRSHVQLFCDCTCAAGSVSVCVCALCVCFMCVSRVFNFILLYVLGYKSRLPLWDWKQRKWIPQCGMYYTSTHDNKKQHNTIQYNTIQYN